MNKENSEMMKAWVASKYGGLEVMAFAEIEKPKITKGKMLIEIKNAALNPYDYKLRNGIAKWMSRKKFPKVYGGDFVGKVVKLQDDKSSFYEGQMVYGFANIFFGGQGSLAEYSVINPRFVRPLPEGIDPIDACASVSAGLTGLSGIQKCGNLRNKQILINGATGGIGHLVTQMSIAKGGIVTAVCSGKNAELAKKLGAASVIDYQKKNILEQKGHFDIVYDAAAKLTYTKAKGILKKQGIYCTTEEGIKPTCQALLSKVNPNTSMFLSSFRGRVQDFEELESLMISNQVKPVIYKTYSLEETGKAFELLEKGGFNGKLLIKIRD